MVPEPWRSAIQTIPPLNLAAAAIPALLVIVVLWRWRAGATDGLIALGIAGGLCLLGAALAHLVGRLVERLGAGPEAGAQGAQLAIAVRMLLTLAMSLPFFLIDIVPTLPFGIALVAHYLAQMALEVFVSLRELSQNPTPTGASARAPQPEAGLPTGPQATSTAEDGSGANQP